MSRQVVAQRSTAHPLDPLSPLELKAALAIVHDAEQYKTLIGPSRYITVALSEPPKELLWDADERPPRCCEVVLLDKGTGTTYEIRVNLDVRSVERWKDVPGVQPASLILEINEAAALVARDEHFIAAMRRRGIEDMSKVLVDPWPPGNFGDPAEAGLRLARVVCRYQEEPGDNGNARPIDGVVALVDLNKMKVVRVDDYGVIPVPPERANYDTTSVGELRDDLRPIDIVQLEGPSFSVDGWAVTWQRWHLRVGFHPREGLVLHMVGYEDGGRVRPILHRAALSEMVVPYGDPAPWHYFKCVIDAGENAVGSFVNPLTLGCDCLGEIFYFDAAYCNELGEVVTIPNAICMHEEDYGILWRHMDWSTMEGESRRSRRLVISCWATVGNYDYGFFWYFYQDGTLSYEVKLTGLLNNAALEPGQESPYGPLVAPQLSGMIHQHFFNVRLDMAVDGMTNSIEEVEAEGLPHSPENPYGNAMVSRRRVLRRESEAQRVIDPMRARCWDIVNPHRVNRLGKPVAYRLIAGENTLPFAVEGSPALGRVGFTTRHVWATPFDPAERYAAGEYPYQHAGGDGLPAWTSKDRPIEDCDLVVWYTFGHHHVPRPEDLPIMPVEYIGFSLKPVGFFDRNPALDVPPSHAEQCAHEPGEAAS